MANTEEEYLTQEKFDAEAHGSMRALFEHLLLQTLEGARQGKQEPSKVETLLESFNNTSNSVQRLMGKLRRAEGKLAAARPAPPCESHLLAVLSTGHLTEEEARSMEESPPEDFPFVISAFEEGWFVSCHTLAEDPAAEPTHGPYAEGRWPCLRALRQWAAERGFGYLMLDRDADRVPDLPYYEW